MYARLIYVKVPENKAECEDLSCHECYYDVGLPKKICKNKKKAYLREKSWD